MYFVGIDWNWETYKSKEDDGRSCQAILVIQQKLLVFVVHGDEYNVIKHVPVSHYHLFQKLQLYKNFGRVNGSFRSCDLFKYAVLVK